MVTVATSLDVPIKLVFPGPNRGGMLGLGDIVLPGIMMALALRFDLYLYYLRKPYPRAHIHSLTPSAKPKPTYEPAKGKWGERWWTRSLPISALPPTIAGSVFPKVYFYASIAGYVVGMLVTVIVLNVFHHAQPALLYLVPGVLGALWGTALFRGELELMWRYTEAGDVDDEKKEVEEGKVGAASNEKEKESEKDSEKDKERDDKKDGVKEKEKEKDKRKAIADEHAHHVFLFSLSSPRHGAKKSKSFDTSA